MATQPLKIANKVKLIKVRILNKPEVLKNMASLVVGAMFFVMPVFAQADYAGADALDALQGMLTGNIGLTLGLAVLVLGLFTLITGKISAGLVMILGGALITLSPGIFNGVRSMVYGVVSQFSNGNTTSVDRNRSY